MMNEQMRPAPAGLARQWACAALLAHAACGLAEEPLVRSLRQVKPAVAAVGGYARIARTGMRIFGTAFFVSPEGHMLTAAHVTRAIRANAVGGKMLVFRQGQSSRKGLAAKVLAEDEAHDVAVIKVEGKDFPAARLGKWDAVQEGQAIAVCGYPYGMVFGLYAACQSGIVSNVSPAALPAFRSSELTAERIRALRRPFSVFQLDCVAYPGNSGGPLFLQATGEVVGVVSSAFIQARKEGPKLERVHTAISYAIPVNHAQALLTKLGVGSKP